MPGDPVGDTAKQQAAATAGALGRHDDQIGVGRVVDDAFGGSPVSDASLDGATRRTEPCRDLLEVPRRGLAVWMLLRADAEQPHALRGQGDCPTQRGLGAFRAVQRNQDAIEPGHGAVPVCYGGRAQKDDGHPGLTQQFFGNASEHPARVALTVRRDYEHVTVNAGRDDGRGGGTRQDLPRGGKSLPHELSARALDPLPGEVESICLCLVAQVRVDGGHHASVKVGSPHLRPP